MNYDVIPTLIFKRNVKKLKKTYSSIGDDIKRYVENLKRGNFSGNILRGVGNNSIYKDRIKNSDIKKGKSGGYRIIYYVITQDKEVYLLTLYSKSSRENIDLSAIKKIIIELGF
jgi:mRNA-degrading endonuclease RelE of RelBE toxin-antitoxin system